MIVSHAEHLSKNIARNIRTTMLSTWYKELFETRIKKGHAAVTDFGTTGGGGVFVTSFAAGFTGRRADVIIVDDPHDIDDDVEQIEGTIETFNTVLLSRLNDRKNGRVLVIAHRVHERDLSAFLLRKQKKWKHVVLPLVATRDQTYETIAGTWHRSEGELLRPGTFDVDDLEDLRANAFNPDFEMLYQQDCDFQALPAIEGRHFITFDAPPPAVTPVVLSVDAGTSNRPRGAYSVIQVWCAYADHYFLLSQFRQQCGLAELQDEVRRFRRIYRPVAILIERAANGYGLISLLSRKYGDVVIPVDVDGRSKSARLRVHAQKIIDCRICIPADEEWTERFIEELVEFPDGKHTDQVDAMTQYLDRAAEFAGLTSMPREGGAVAISGRGCTTAISRSTTRTPGIAAGVRGNGQPIIPHQSVGPVIKITSEVVWSPSMGRGRKPWC